ncbi:hypothetical protein SLEP1_g2966 [Rubroshorea leprosula]|uniref:CCHC-type domain-containing protein n=1 Tax=Rubroshorea leprosula TaxID=152421 RepID=A0AAV5HQC2_9ROSI|nr:hypothetical protein SLEP1_g2966 [Rubroshorea leprosula]
MAQFQATSPLEGLSTTKPPFFDGANYNYWKNRMKIYMLANEPKVWLVTMNGPYVPMKVVGESEVPKEEIEWSDEDLEKIMINNKAINMLHCALNLMEINRTSEFEVIEKKKNVAFKASNQKEESEDEDDANDGEDISALISKEVKRLMKKKNFKNRLAKGDEAKSSKKNVKCYECNKIGHYRNECLQLKKGERKDKKSMKKKDFATTSSDDETSSTESESSLENGVANLYFMAQEDSNNDEEANSNFSSLINESSFEYSYDELCKVLDCSMNDIKKLGNGNLALTKTISLLKNEIESLSKQNEVLVKENASLNVEIASLKNEESNNALKKENEDLKRKVCDLEKVCLVSKMKNKWYLDNGCSRHMTSDPLQFSSLMSLDGGTVTFGDNGKGIVKGIDANIYLASISHDDTWLWHRRLGHASMNVISKLSRHDLVDGLLKVNVNIDGVCDACMKGKQTRVSFKAKKCISANKPLELLHMDLFGPMRILSVGGKSYVLVVVDAYSRFT